MAVDLNFFRVLGDLAHTASKCILIWAIHSNKSAEGVSLLTQLLYFLVFTTRYLDLFWVPPWYSWWNFTLKLFYISSSIYIVWLMMKVYARTREKEYAWKLATTSLVASSIGSPVVCLLFSRISFSELFWSFSIILESICVLPQLLLLRQTSVPTVLDSYYLITLGSYRFFYILNWLLLLIKDRSFDPISVIFGIIQTALYVDFAWVYYSRQRVKLRGGGVVDADDFSKSYLVRRFMGRGGRADRGGDDIADEDEGLANQESGTVRESRDGRNWGARGISVRADDTLEDGNGAQQGGYADVAAAGDAQMIDPAHFEDDDDDADAPPPPVAKDDKYKSSDGSAVSEVDDSTTEWAQNDGNHK